METWRVKAELVCEKREGAKVHKKLRNYKNSIFFQYNRKNEQGKQGKYSDFCPCFWTAIWLQCGNKSNSPLLLMS